MAVAIPIDYTFDVYFDGGGPGGAVPVNVTLDGVTGTNIETFSPGMGNLLAFEFAYLGQTYGITDDSAFPAAPLIALEDGALTDIAYMGRKALLGGRITLSAFIELSDQVNSTTYARVGPGLFTFTSGEVAPDTWRRVSAPITTPATFALFCLGLAGLGIARRNARSIAR